MPLQMRTVLSNFVESCFGWFDLQQDLACFYFGDNQCCCFSKELRVKIFGIIQQFRPRLEFIDKFTPCKEKKLLTCQKKLPHNFKTLISRDQQLTKIVPWQQWKHSSYHSTHNQKVATDKIERKEQQLPLSSRGKLTDNL